MRWCPRLSSLLLAWGLAGAIVSAQSPLPLHGRVLDASGRPVEGASVLIEAQGRESKAVSASDGRYELDIAKTVQASQPESAVNSMLVLRAVAPGMESEAVRVTIAQVVADPAKEIDLMLRPSAVHSQVTVTATRSSLGVATTANTVYALTAENLNDYPDTELDDKLRQQAGFELFRRSSSRVQNPTSQGISLRGLGSTAASRTLVLADNTPMNDPFGGWIHWDEIPSLAVEAVTIATGGGSDLYGSSALSGVIDVVPAHPSTARAEAAASGAGENTSAVNLRGDLGEAHWAQLLAADLYRTAGYTPAAPSISGPVDVAANVHSQAARAETDRLFGPNPNASGREPASAFLVGNLLNEARGNGTALTNNGTRLWRYLGGDDWTAGQRGSGRVRLFGSDEAYRQTFSSVNATRTLETLTKRQNVRTQELGASSDASVVLAPFAFVVGVDVRDLRATDNEVSLTASPSGNTSARQRFVGGFGEALATKGRWSGALSLRLDSASNLDTQVYTLPSTSTQPVATPNRNEIIPSPRLGIVRQVTSQATVHASVFRAFRTPTMNELYRTGQVGQETTQANAQLQSERATGWEAGAAYISRGGFVALTGTYFWTEINRPVSAVLISSTATSILEKRQNLGQILSQGTELHLELRARSAISATVGYEYAHALVTRFSAQPTLVGNWIPEVPRQSLTAQLRMRRARIGELTVAARASGHAFDDSANTPAYILNPFFELDASARHAFGPRWSAFVDLTNITNQRPDVARTPTLTLGSPLLAQAGVAFRWNGRAPH